MGFVSEEDAIRGMVSPSKAYTSIKDIPAEEIQKLIKECNYHSYLYDQGKPLISDEVWDDIYFTIKEWEKITGIVYANSPTQNIPYQTVSKLDLIEHEHLMLSLDKTKEPFDIEAFLEGQEYVGMFKMDGLTCSLTYENGVLTRAETRGNGKKGENILHNARVVKNIPQKISITDRKIVVDGEIICNISNFAQFVKEYKNPRNFAAGSIRLLSAEECSKRNLEFIAWDLIEGLKSVTFTERLIFLKELGFTVVPYIFCRNIWGTSPSFTIKDLDDLRKEYSHYPIDGYVFKFDNIEFGEKKGKTDHHFKNAIAFKFYDELYDTHLKYIDWTMGRTGVLTPVAVFEPIDIDGSTVERASLHNVSVMEKLFGDCAYVGEHLKVFKANQIIPQIAEVYPKYDGKTIAKADITKCGTLEKCPYCATEVKLIKSPDGVLNYYCVNDSCGGQLVNKLDHFCGKKGLDIKGISKATLNKLIDKEWISCCEDIFKLKDYRSEWIKMPGFGVASVDKILKSIEEHSNTTLSQFISALGIPLIGATASKDLAAYFFSYEDFRKAINSKEFSFTQFANFGYEMDATLKHFDYSEADKLFTYLSIKNEITTEDKEIIKNEKLKNKTIVITGKLNHFKNREELKKVIVQNGGRVMDSITNKTDLLINNDVNSNSSKNKSAKAKGIMIISEEDFMRLYLEK